MLLTTKGDWIICDIDGTLRDFRHRLHLLPNFGSEQELYDIFNREAEHDSPKEAIIEILVMAHKSGKQICLMTGLPAKERIRTITWLQRYKVPYSILMTRSNGDLRHDWEVKQELYEHSFKASGIEPLFVMEDRDSLVKMWRAQGLTCLQVCEGIY